MDNLSVKNSVKKAYSREEENSFMQSLKPNLTLRVGDVVCLKSDIKHKVSMTVAAIFWDDENHDCRCEWMNQQKKRECGLFTQDSLVKIK